MNPKASHNARWNVYVRLKGRWRVKRFGDDFNSALSFYVECKNKKLITVFRSQNVGFSPPTRILHHPKVRYEVVRRKGKRLKKKVLYHVNLMLKYNERGIWWCPYCIRLLKFEERDEYRHKLMCCPVCQVSNRDFHVRQSNPKAVIVEMHGKTRRTRGSGSARRRVRRSR